MRYTHSINAVKGIEWGLNLNQGALMDLINQASSWAKPCVVDGEVYYWMSRNMIVDEIPLAYSKPDTVYRAIKALAAKDLIIHIKEGKKDLIKMTEKGKTWNVKGTIQGDAKLGFKSELDKNTDLNPTKLGNESENNSDLNPTDKSTNNTPNTINKINIDFDTFWSTYDYKQAAGKCETKWKSLTNKERELTMEHLPAYVISKPVKRFRKHPLTYLNNAGWLDEIEVTDTSANSNRTNDSLAVNNKWGVDSTPMTDEQKASWFRDSTPATNDDDDLPAMFTGNNQGVMEL